MKVISLGWGVQSFALAAMSALGVLPPVAAAVHADTGHERKETYEFAERWTPWLEERGVRVVTARDKMTPYKFDQNGVFIPAYSMELFERKEQLNPFLLLGWRGQMRRSCTHRWKIVPIRRWLQANRNIQPVEQWLGITLDEITRMKQSNVKYIANTYPFIEMLDRPWTRGMAIK